MLSIDELKTEQPEKDSNSVPTSIEKDNNDVTQSAPNGGTPTPSTDEPKISEDKRFNFTTIEAFDFIGTPTRYRELHRFLQILQAPVMNVPLLIADHSEDILPLLSLCVHEARKSGKELSFFSVTPSDFNMEYGDKESPFDMRDTIRDNISMGGTIIEEGEDVNSVPVYCDVTEYDNWGMLGNFVKNFLEIGKDAIILCRQNELAKIRQFIQNDRSASNGVENSESPYSKGLAKASELKIAPLTDNEKYTYFLNHFINMLDEQDVRCTERVGDYLIREALKRTTPENVFVKTFEVMDKALSLTISSGKNVVSTKIAKRALDEKLPLHNGMKALANMDARLKKKIFGQDQAINQCYETILSQLDDTHREKPTVLAFFGPSGVGKTALAEEISLAMTGKKITTINMAEYADSFKVSILIGSSKGYVDSDEDGLLAKVVKENPNAVILLDEFEKAHQQVQQMFLGVFDKGSVFDNHAGQIDMSQTTIILTSNAGVRPANSIGFGNAGNQTYIADEKMVQDAFPNELLGRLDAKVFFQPLSEEVLDKIVDKSMKKLQPRFEQLGVRVSLSKTARQELVEKAKDPASGARPLLSLIRQKIKVPIEMAAIKKKIKPGDHILINSIQDNDRIKIMHHTVANRKVSRDNDHVHV